MKIMGGAHSNFSNLIQEMEAYGIRVVAEKNNDELIKSTLEQKGIRGVVTVGSVDQSITFSMHRLRPNGDYIKESFDYDPNRPQKWFFGNSVAIRCSEVKGVFDYIFSQQHENAL